MALPVVAIVGRPNVGKSSLLNLLAGRRISIVEPTAGVTRDRVSTIVQWQEHYFELVDTGGYGIEDRDDLAEQVEQQIALAIEKAQVVLFVVNVREGVTPLDVEVAKLLRGGAPQVVLVANKADGASLDGQAGEFLRLGFGEPWCVSALHGRNKERLADRIVELLAGLDTAAPPEAVMKIAVVGKRNVGKSTFINCLAGEERMIVSETPGTTRDSVDVVFEKDGRRFIAIDTAGLRKKSRVVQNDVEYYSYQRALRSIRRADVVLLFLDATAEVSVVDKQLGQTIVEQYVPCVVVVNKWDLAKERATTAAYGEYITKTLPGLDHAPIAFLTAKDGKNVQSVLDVARELHKQAGRTVGTPELNRVLRAVMAERAPSARRKTGLPKVYYGTQVARHPPTLLLFVNNPDALDENYQRFLVGRLRELLPFTEVPIRLLVRHHREGAEPRE